MPNELRDEIAGVIADARNEDYDGCLTMDLDEAVDSILSLIDAQRCVWTLISNEMGSDFYRTSCGEASFVLNKYCRYCGKRIEVKDGQG